jgi:hypothetical protein
LGVVFGQPRQEGLVALRPGRKMLSMPIFQPNLAQFCPLARVVAGFLNPLNFHCVAMHMKFYFLP